MKTRMNLNEYIAMSVAHELINESSRLASDDFTVSKDLVIKVMEKHGYDEVAYPKYEYFGVEMGAMGAMGAIGGKRKTRKRSGAKYKASR